MTIIEGKLIKGRGLGKTLGFPTLNIPYDGRKIGVFGGKIFIGGNEYIAAINLGKRPTFDDEDILCEAFLLNWTGEKIKHGTMIKIELGKKIREVKKFTNIQELRKQIAKDVEFVKSCYNL